MPLTDCEFHHELTLNSCRSYSLKSDLCVSLLLLPIGIQVCSDVDVALFPGLQISINLGVACKVVIELPASFRGHRVTENKTWLERS